MGQEQIARILTGRESSRPRLHEKRTVSVKIKEVYLQLLHALPVQARKSALYEVELKKTKKLYDGRVWLQVNLKRSFSFLKSVSIVDRSIQLIISGF